ncbi:MAG: hypothetical protein Q7R47_00840, partial [Candidatus Diapherotrites archaeon]|nr:hypothetical protein [Candidatus Diapherotrites archaeon]
GFSLGSGAYVASNFFVWGLQGPWTVFQAVGAGVAGVAAGFFGKTKKPSEMDLIWVTVAGTLFFEVVMNSYGALFSMGLFGLGLLTIPLYFLTSLPFSLVHIVSNAAFAKGLGPLLKKWSRKTNELEIVAVNRVVGDKRTGIRMYKAR